MSLHLTLLSRGPRTADPKRIIQLCSNLLAWWGDSHVDAITEGSCGGYCLGRTQQAASRGTARRELGCLRAAILWDQRHGRLLNAPHVWLPPALPGRDRWLTRGEAARLLRFALSEPKARGHLPLFIVLALYTGARRGSILDLRWHQVDLVRGRIDFRRPDGVETSKRRAIVPIPRQLLGHLRRAQARAACNHVIEYDGKPVKSVKRSFNHAAVAAALLDVGTHTLRHTAATWMAQRGVDLWQVGGYLGHSDERTTRRYAHHSPEYLRQAKEALEG